MSHQGKQISSPMDTKSNTGDEIGMEQGDSRARVHRYIRLTNLIPQLLQMVDEKKIAFRPAVELSYLTEEEQYQVEKIKINKSKIESVLLKKNMTEKQQKQE